MAMEVKGRRGYSILEGQDLRVVLTWIHNEDLCLKPTAGSFMQLQTIVGVRELVGMIGSNKCG